MALDQIYKECLIIMFIQVIKIIRFIDSAVFAASPIDGLLFFLSEVGLEVNLFKLAFSIVAVYLLAVHVFAINDWFDYPRDLKDQNKRSRADMVSRKAILILSVISGFGAFVFLSFLSYTSVFVGIVLVILSFLYSASWQSYHGKGIPTYSSFLHILGGVFSFQLGVSIFGDISSLSIFIGFIIGFFLAGGHLIQELQDNEGDRINGVGTNVVILGKKTSLNAALIFFTFGHSMLYFLIDNLDLSMLIWANTVTAIVIIAIIVYIRSYYLGFKVVSKLRALYRFIYLIFGSYMIFEVLLKTLL
ncbi:UbiA family prenyltransferase [Lentimicrobium sp. S6]|nr:UbiA family prenyltransferase [Lentimicrobium sp. S6]NPD45541.1 UbiA family prenyltransferase [Lentimicrobium sp. S6]